MAVHYLEIVTNDADTLTGLYEEHGAIVAYPPTRQGQRGTFAIVIQGDVQHGLWQR